MTGSAGRLVFAGLGLHDEDGITSKALKEAERADVIFAETYTSSLEEGAIERLEARLGRKLEMLDRAAVEDGRKILDAAKSRNVVFLVGGDPMTATTHIDLRLRAAEESIETVVIHGVSVMTAVPGLLGLQHYKFGRTASLPFPQEGYSPTSPCELVGENLSRGLHTLVLLDVDADGGRFMTANEGIHLLLDMDRRSGRGTLSESSLMCVVARAGSSDCLVRAGSAKALLEEDFGPPLHCLVVPGRLHFMEERALEVFAGWNRLGRRESHS
ncbi:MAG: diphthine synthase [Candidatus Thermoplasmatota archaeon]|nr:diphthine synthase [Candidatus Thermoplasmatota archaeon]